jgi:hypothetical protein
MARTIDHILVIHLLGHRRTCHTSPPDQWFASARWNMGFSQELVWSHGRVQGRVGHTDAERVVGQRARTGCTGAGPLCCWDCGWPRTFPRSRAGPTRLSSLVASDEIYQSVVRHHHENTCQAPARLDQSRLGGPSPTSTKGVTAGLLDIQVNVGRTGRVTPFAVMAGQGQWVGGGGGDFAGARFSGGTVRFDRARFSGSQVDFRGARCSGSAVSFVGARFSGSAVDFSDPWDWSFLPEFPWTDTPPPGVKLPRRKINHRRRRTWAGRAALAAGDSAAGPPRGFMPPCWRSPATWLACRYSIMTNMEQPDRDLRRRSLTLISRHPPAGCRPRATR